MAFLFEKRGAPRRGGQKPKQSKSTAGCAMVRQGLRVALKGKTPSARARLKYIMRQGDYAKGREGPRDDLAGYGSGNLPSWAKGRPGRFWRAVDQFERANGRKCVELELNLPAELTLEQQHAAIRAFGRRVCGPERLPFTYAIHAAPGNGHVHFMIHERGLDGIERTPQGHFKRASNVDPSLGGARKSRSITGAAWTFNTRCVWAETLNAALVQHGHQPRFNPHSKAAQAVEALRAGDLRRYGELCTLTERHEGPKIHGMRRRWERGELDWEQIPEGAQATIRHNDHARAHNNALRDWLRSATDEQLAERFGDDLREQLELDNPGSHVAAWLAAQHVQALDDDRQRAVASALAAGELELLAAQQIEIEQAHAEALAEAAELADLMTGEALDIVQQRLALEHEQAHAAALIEDAQRAEDAALDALLHGLHALCDALDELRDRDPAAGPAVRAALDEADRLLALPPPSPALGASLAALESDYRQMLADERARQAEARRRAEARQQAEEQARTQREARQQAEQIAQQQRGQAEAQRQQVIEHARSEYRAADRRVLEALAALQRAQGTLEYQQRRLAEVPALQKQRGALVGQANEHAAAVRRLRAERAAWLADHPVRSRTGLTGPADALLEQENKHFEAYERLAAQVEQIDSRVRWAQPSVEQAQRAVEAAQTALREAESRADQRFDDAGGPDAALRRAGLTQPAPLRERFAEGLQRVEERTQEPDQDQGQGWSGPRMR